jgi:hypothetical protein
LSTRYWNDPAILQKLGGAMGDVLDFEAMLGGLPGAGGAEEDEEEEGAEEEVQNLHTAASDGEQQQGRSRSSPAAYGARQSAMPV